MAVVIAALLPVFLLIVLGFILKHSLMPLDTQWHGLERHIDHDEVVTSAQGSQEPWGCV